MSDLLSSDYYKIMGIARNAADIELKKAYRKLALRWHPDKNQDNKELASENFKKIAEAYEILSDTNKRNLYNKYGKQGLERGSRMSGGGEGRGRGPGHTRHFHFSNANDIFKQFFHNESPGSPGSPGSKKNIHFSFKTNGNNIDLTNLLFNNGASPMSHNRQKINSNLFLQENTPIIIKGLINNSELNNKYGLIKNYNRSKKRYLVEGPNGNIYLKPFNIIQQVSNVRLNYIIRHPELNNKIGKIVGWDDYKFRLKIKLDEDSLVYVKQTNVIYPINTLVYIKNLENKIEYNNTIGKIITYNLNKYTIQLHNNIIIKLGLNNVSIIAPNI